MIGTFPLLITRGRHRSVIRNFCSLTFVLYTVVCLIFFAPTFVLFVYQDLPRHLKPNNPHFNIYSLKVMVCFYWNIAACLKCSCFWLFEAVKHNLNYTENKNDEKTNSNAHRDQQKESRMWWFWQQWHSEFIFKFCFFHVPLVGYLNLFPGLIAGIARAGLHKQTNKILPVTLLWYV